MGENQIQNLRNWLEKQKKAFDSFLNDMRKCKLKALRPSNQGKILASAGVIGFINEELKYLDTLNSDVCHINNEEIL